MRAAQIGRFRRGLVDLAPIYAHNVRYAERSIAYAAEHGLMAFRLSSDVLPLLDQGPELRRLVPSLAPLRRLVRETGVHVSNHPAQFVVLSSPSEAVVANATGFLRDTAWLMDRIGAEGSITIHGGGVYGDRAAAAARLRANVAALPRAIRRYLALENDEKCWTVPELLEATSGAVPIVFDKLHWEANPRSAPYATELAGALATWPADRATARRARRLRHRPRAAPLPRGDRRGCRRSRRRRHRGGQAEGPGDPARRRGARRAPARPPARAGARPEGSEGAKGRGLDEGGTAAARGEPWSRLHAPERTRARSIRRGEAVETSGRSIPRSLDPSVPRPLPYRHLAVPPINAREQHEWGSTTLVTGARSASFPLAMQPAHETVDGSQ